MPHLLSDYELQVPFTLLTSPVSRYSDSMSGNPCAMPCSQTVLFPLLSRLVFFPSAWDALSPLVSPSAFYFCREDPAQVNTEHQASLSFSGQLALPEAPGSSALYIQQVLHMGKHLPSGPPP